MGATGGCERTPPISVDVNPSGDVESRRVFGPGIEDFKSTDIGARRSHAEESFETIQLFDRSRGVDFDASIVKIARPSADAGLCCGALGEVAESHALDTARNQKSFCATFLHFRDFSYGLRGFV